MVGRKEVLRHRPELDAVWTPADQRFPVRVTRSWWSRMDPANPEDPLALQALPHASELEEAPGDLVDPVGDAARSPVPWVVHKYPDRVLLLLTKRCHLYCRYCFRSAYQPGEGEDPTPQALDAAIAYATTCGATEAILSGGDPLAVRDVALFRVIDRLRAGGLQQVRIHTRAPITQPSRVTPALVEGLALRRPLRMIVHVNHPNELSSDVDLALARLVGSGVDVLDQTVLLAGVNDDAEVLVRLMEALLARGVRPYYLHHTDAAPGNAALRVDLQRGLAIHEEVGRRLGDRAPRYVIDPPDGSGKIDVARFVALRDAATGIR